jgi:hypothetical protein
MVRERSTCESWWFHWQWKCKTRFLIIMIEVPSNPLKCLQFQRSYNNVRKRRRRNGDEKNGCFSNLIWRVVTYHYSILLYPQKKNFMQHCRVGVWEMSYIYITKKNSITEPLVGTNWTVPIEKEWKSWTLVFTSPQLIYIHSLKVCMCSSYEWMWFFFSRNSLCEPNGWPLTHKILFRP